MSRLLTRDELDGMRVWLGQEPPTEAEMAAAPWAPSERA